MLSTLEDPSKVLPKGTLPELEKHPGYVVAHFQSKAAVQVRLCHAAAIANLALLFYDT